MDSHQFEDVKAVIVEPLKFKAKLAIGEGAYGSLTMVNKVGEFWDTYGWATTGAAVAKSTVVATTFFAPSGLLGLLGVGAAVTPIGWVVTAAVLTGGAAIGVRRFLNESTTSRVTVIPKFINTPIDVLAISLFDLIAPLALKVAATDGKITDDERACIQNYFLDEWGYDNEFLYAGLVLIESKLGDISTKDIAERLAKYGKENPDCNFDAISKDLMVFLTAIMEADGVIDELEELVIEKIGSIFKEAGEKYSAKSVRTAGSKIAGSLVSSAESLGKGVFTLKNTIHKNASEISKSKIIENATSLLKDTNNNMIDSAISITNNSKALFHKLLKKSK